MLAFLDVFSKSIKDFLKNKPTMEFTNIEIHPDAFDNKYHVSLTETVPVRNGYGFEKKKFIVDKEKIEKKLEELINIIKK